MLRNRPGRSHGTGPYGQSYGALRESEIGQGMLAHSQDLQITAAVGILAYVDP